MVAQDGDGNLKEFAGITVIAEQRGNLRGRDRRVSHKAVGKELDRHARGHPANDLALLAINLSHVIDKLAMFHPPFRVGRNKSEFVGGFPRSFDGADTILIHWLTQLQRQDTYTLFTMINRD